MSHYFLFFRFYDLAHAVPLSLESFLIKAYLAINANIININNNKGYNLLNAYSVPDSFLSTSHIISFILIIW